MFVPQHDVEVAIKGLGIEDEREKAALRAFYARQRETAPGLRLNPKKLLWFLFKIAVASLVVWAVIVGFHLL